MRTWTSLPEKTIEAEYVKILFDEVVLKDANGKEIKVPLSLFTGEDLKYIELANPPQLSVDLLKSVSQDFVPQSPFPTGGTIPEPPNLLIYQFGARVKQLDAKTYNHKLKIKLYAVTQQRSDQDKYHLISKTESPPFVMSKENGRRYEFTGPHRHRVLSYTIHVDYLSWEELRGEKFGETLILVVDERDEVVAYNGSKNWLYEIHDKLEKLPAGAWLDRTGTRVHPTPPKVTKAPGANWL
jgi:hypothetical protein